MRAYAHFFHAHPRWVAAFVVVALGVFGVGLTRLAFDDEPRGILRSDAPEFALLEEVWRDFGADDNEALVVLDGGPVLSVDGLRALERLVRDLRGIDGVERVSSIASLVEFRGLVPRPLVPAAEAFGALTEAERDALAERVAAHPLVAGRLVSGDGETALIVAHIAPDVVEVEDLTLVVDAIRSTVERISAESPRRARVTGIPSVRVELYRTTRFEQILFFSLASLLCTAIAWWLFRDWRSVVVAAVPPFFGAVFAGGAFGWLGWRIDLLGTVIPMLVTVIGFTDAVHLTIHARHEIGAGRTPLAAAADAIRRVGKACFLTSLTTAIGFGSLALGQIEVINRFGLMSALAMGLAFVAVLSGLPVLAALLLRPGQRDTRRSSELLFARLVPWIERRAAWIVGVGALLVLGLGAVATTLETENHLLEATPKDSPTFTALRDLEEAFGGALPMYVLVEWDESLAWSDESVRAAVRDVSAFLDADSDTGRAFSVFDALRAAPPVSPETALELVPEAITGRLVRPDLGRLLVAALVPDAGRDVMLPLFQRVEAELDRLDAAHPGVTLRLTGTDVVARTHIHAMIADLATSLGFATLVIFLAISWAFGSFRYGLASLLPNVFPLVVIAGVIRVSGRSLEMSSAVVFSVLLGLAVDDTIHFLSRWRDERARTDAPLRPTLIHVGKAITWTTIVLSAGLGVTLTSSVPTTRWFATLCIVGLVAAWFGDLILLPALMYLGRRRPRELVSTSEQTP
ncbi:MAG: MMPL family transporter [Planctomycetota bacterium]